MGEWLHNLPIGRMALVVFGLTYVGAAVIFAAVGWLARGERLRAFKGVSAGLLPPLGIIFGLFVAFIASQVWNDGDRARTAVNTEANALSTVVYLAASFPGEAELRLRELTRRDIQDTVANEWPMMALHTASLTITPVPLAQALQLTLSLAPENDGQVTAQREIVSALERAIEARRLRIVVSRSTVNWVKWLALVLQGVCTLLAIAMVHSDNRGAAMLSMGIFATGIAVSILLIASHDLPFSGEISVGPDPLKQVIPEEETSQDEIDHAVLLDVTSLLRAARQVLSDRFVASGRPNGGDRLTGKQLLELAKVKYAEQTGHALPVRSATSPEGRMLQAELDAMNEVMDQAREPLLPAVFAYRVAERFDQKVGDLAYVKLTAPEELVRHQPNRPDAWETEMIKSRFEAPSWKKGDFVAQEGPLNGKKAYRMLIPEYYEASCLACHGEPKGALDSTGGRKEGGKLGDIGGAVSAAIYLK